MSRFGIEGERYQKAINLPPSFSKLFNAMSDAPYMHIPRVRSPFVLDGFAAMPNIPRRANVAAVVGKSRDCDWRS